MNNRRDQIAQVINYIYKNSEDKGSDKLSLAKLSDVAGFSKYHFGRIFAAETGLTANRFIQFIKLKRASCRLSFNPEKRIIDIALEAGFDSHEAFSRAFKRIYNQTPSEFRNQPDWENWHDKNKFETVSLKSKRSIEIIDIDEQHVAVLEHRGSPAKLNSSLQRFMMWRELNKKMSKTTSRKFGIAYQDPDLIPGDDFIFEICESVDFCIEDNSFGVKSATIPRGRCARLIHVGPYSLIGEKIQYLYQIWLPTVNYQLRDFPCFFEYVNSYPDASEAELLTYIYLPLV